MKRRIVMTLATSAVAALALAGCDQGSQAAYCETFSSQLSSVQTGAQEVFGGTGENTNQSDVDEAQTQTAAILFEIQQSLPSDAPQEVNDAFDSAKSIINNGDYSAAEQAKFASNIQTIQDYTDKECPNSDDKQVS